MLPLSRCNSAGFRILLAIALLLIFWQAISPKPITIVAGSDKLLHGLAFLFLAFLADAGWSERAYDWRKFIPLMAYGVLIELCQTQVPGRFFSLADMVADAIGLALYPIIPFVIYRFFKIRDPSCSSNQQKP